VRVRTEHYEEGRSKAMSGRQAKGKPKKDGVLVRGKNGD